MKCTFRILVLTFATLANCPSLLGAQTSPVDSLLASAKEKEANGDVTGAITDYSKAIALQPKDPQLYSKRGLTKEGVGDNVGAIADYNKAISLKPDEADFYAIRGSAKLATGDTDGCYADCLKAVQIDSSCAMAFLNMGFQRLVLRKFTDATFNFNKFVVLVPQSDYARFQLWVARSRNGEMDAANKELQAYLAQRKEGTPNDWPSSIGRFLTGSLNEGAFLKIAVETKTPKAGEFQCEAYFYAGTKHLVAGDKKSALDYFQKCIATGEKGQTEYFCAQAEVKFLQSEKNTPAP